jgi:peptidoglycan hydrolase-like protein with peptidoglycan-binding domain
VKAGKAGNMLAPYTQMAQSAILAIGVPVDVVPAQDVAYLQAGLIRLGFDPGRIDGVQGNRTMKALQDAGANLAEPLTWLSDALRAKYPAEYV